MLDTVLRVNYCETRCNRLRQELRECTKCPEIQNNVMDREEPTSGLEPLT